MMTSVSASSAAQKKKLFLYYILSVVLSLFAAIAGSVAFLTSFDREIGYLNSHAIPTILWSVCPIVMLVVSVSVFFLFRKNTLPCNSVSVPLPFRAFCGGMSVILLSYAIFGAVAQNNHMVPLVSLLMVIRSVLSLVSAGYFLSIAFEKRFSGTLRAVGALTLPLFLILMLAVWYFDYFVAMNGPVKIPLQLSAIVLLLVLLHEIRLLIGGVYIRPRSAIATSLLAMFACYASSVPVIVAWFGALLNKEFTDYVACALVLLCFAVYLTFRIAGYLRITEVPDTAFTEVNEPNNIPNCPEESDS